MRGLLEVDGALQRGFGRELVLAPARWRSRSDVFLLARRSRADTGSRRARSCRRARHRRRRSASGSRARAAVRRWLRPLRQGRVADRRAWCGCGRSIGPSPIGGSFGSRRARASRLRRNRLEGARLKYSVRPSIILVLEQAGRVPARRIRRRAGPGSACARGSSTCCVVEGEVEQDPAHAFALEGVAPGVLRPAGPARPATPRCALRPP